MIALVDYGAGNLASVRKALAAVGADVFVPSSPADLEGARGIVIPGVGHFAATASLDNGWRGAFGRALDRGVPLLGICLGMQWLFDGSDESPHVPGLGYCRGRMTRLPARSEDGLRIKVPHVGWNVVTMLEPDNDVSQAVSQGLKALDGRHVYFTHTFAAPVTGDCVGVTNHGARFAAIVARGSAWGVQFHPEKSGEAGLTLLRAFVKRRRG